MSLLLILGDGEEPVEITPLPYEERTGITAATIQASVQKFLPSGVQYKISEDLGELDREGIFDRLRQIFATRLLVDSGAVFYLIFLVSRRVRQLAASIRDDLETLQGLTALRGVNPDAPTPIESTTELVRAQARLLQLSGSVNNDGVFESAYYDQFSEEVDAWLNAEVRDKVETLSRTEVVARIRQLGIQIDEAWPGLLAYREKLFDLLSKYTSADFRLLATTNVVAAVGERVREIVSEVDGDEVDTTTQATTYLVDLKAGQAALRTITQAPSPVGTEIVAPISDGATPYAFNLVTGQGTLLPPLPIAQGTDGELHIDAISFGTDGETNDDGDGDNYTPDFSSAGGTMVADGAVPGDYITLCNTGEGSVLQTVTDTTATVSPELRTNQTLQRYVITSEQPGKLFKSAAPKDADGNSITFGDFYANGETGSTVVASGSAGTLPRKVYSSGSDGRNYLLKETGTGQTQPVEHNVSGGTLNPQVSSGSTGTTSIGTGNFTDAGATWLTDGVKPGDILNISAPAPVAGQYTVTSVTSETALTVTPNFGGAGSYINVVYTIVEYGVLEDTSATFLTDGIQAGMEFLSTSPSLGPYVIDSVLSETKVQLTYAGAYTTTTITTGLIEQADSDELFRDTGVNFYSEGVVAGEYELVITSTANSNEGVYNITGLRDANTLELGDTQPAGTRSTSEDYNIRPTTGNLGFYSDTYDTFFGSAFEGNTLAVGALSDREIDSVSSTEILVTLAGLWSGTFDGETWEIYDSDGYANTFTQTDGVDFSAGGLDVTFFVNTKPAIISFGGTEYRVTGRVDASTLRIAGDAVPVDLTPAAWELWAGDTTSIFLDTTNNPFASYSAGDRLEIYPGTANAQIFTIESIDAPGQVTLNAEIEANLTNVPYAVYTLVKPGQTLLVRGRRRRIEGIVSANILRLTEPVSGTIGTGNVFKIMAADTSPLTRRLEDTSATFDEDWVGTYIDISLDRMYTAEVTDVPSSTQLQFDAPVPVGRSRVTYAVRSRRNNRLTNTVSGTGLGAAAADDYLCIWGDADIFQVSSSDVDLATVTRLVRSGREDLDVAVTRGGDPEWSRYVLFEDLDGALSLDATTGTFPEQLAEVLADYGSVETNISAGTANGVFLDLDEDDYSTLFEDATVDFTALGVQVGDRIDFVSGAESQRSWVTAVTATQLTISPRCSGVIPSGYSIDRNSVSFAIAKVIDLQSQVQSLIDLYEQYNVKPNSSLASVFRLLEEQGFDRAVDLLYTGDFDTFFALEGPDASFAGAARYATQTAMRPTSSSAQLDAITAGANSDSQGLRNGEYAGAVVANTDTTTTGYTQPLDSAAQNIISRVVEQLETSERVRAATLVNVEEIKNRGVFELIGENDGAVISDTDDTLPYLANLGSKVQQVEAQATELIAALQYMIDHPDEFEDADNE